MQYTLEEWDSLSAEAQFDEKSKARAKSKKKVGRPAGSANYAATVAPARLSDVNKNFKQASLVFYDKAAALKEKCNREGQDEADTTVVTIVVRKAQPKRQPNSSSTTQQGSPCPAGKKRQVNVTASLSNKKEVLAALADTMLLLTGYDGTSPNTEVSFKTDFGFKQVAAMKNDQTNKQVVAVSQVTHEAVSAPGQTGEAAGARILGL